MENDEPEMITVNWYVMTNKVGSKCDGSFEIHADATEEEIEECVRDLVFNVCEWGWKRSDEEGR